MMWRVLYGSIGNINDKNIKPLNGIIETWTEQSFGVNGLVSIEAFAGASGQIIQRRVLISLF